MTKIYINDGSGTVYEYDSSDWSREVVIARGTGAFSISSGPAANTLYLQISSYSAGPLEALDLTTGQIRHIGGSVPGNALGEARNGFLFAGSGVETYRVDPNTGASTWIGDGADPYAGDFAVDPTTNVLYGAVSGVALVTVDRATGRQTNVGRMNVWSIWGMGFSRNGDLFAAGPDGNGGGEIYAVNKATGAARAVRRLSYEPFDMATQPYTRPEHLEWPSPAPPPPPGGGGSGGGVALVSSGVAFEDDLERPTALTGGAGVWAQVTPLDGPRGAGSGARCLEGRARAGARGTIETPSIDLTGARSPVLALRHWFELDAGGAVVRLRGPQGLVTLQPGVGLSPSVAALGGPGFSGSSRGWRDAWFDLSPWAGQTVRLELEVAAGVNEATWFVDDLLVAEASAVEARLGAPRLATAGACADVLPFGLAAFSAEPTGRLVADLDLAGARRATLQLTHAPGPGRLQVSIDGGASWTEVAPLSGWSQEAATAAFDLTPWLGNGRLRLGVEPPGAGWATAARVAVAR